jgi:hypothetical protein
VICLTTWWRIPGDYQLNTNSIDDRDLATIRSWRVMHIAGLIPALMLKWLLVSVLAAISVAISTRVSLVVNLPVVIFIYIAGNLTRFLFPLRADDNWLTRAGAYLLSTVLPYLENFDLTGKTVYERLRVGEFAQDQLATPVIAVWGYVGLAVLYAATYSFFAMMAGLMMFQNRELGGAEG